MLNTNKKKMVAGWQKCLKCPACWLMAKVPMKQWHMHKRWLCVSWQIDWITAKVLRH
jgi:hypothetical protein